MVNLKTSLPILWAPVLGALLCVALLLGLAGCTGGDAGGDPDATAAQGSSPNVPAIVDEPAGQQPPADPEPVAPPVPDAPAEPDPEPVPQYENLAVSYTDASTVFTTPYYTVEVPDGLLPEGWTYEYDDSATTVLATEYYPWARGHKLSFRWPAENPVPYDEYDGFWVEAYSSPNDWPGYQGYFADVKVGSSGAGGGWAVVVASGYRDNADYSGTTEQTVRAKLTEYARYVDPSNVLWGAGWAGPNPYANNESETPAQPDSVQVGPVDPGVQYEGLSVTRTDAGTLFTTGYYSVTIPDGLLPNGWTYEYDDAEMRVFERPDYPWARGHTLRFRWPDATTYSGTEGFWIEAYGSPDDWPGYQGTFVYEKLGLSASGGGWRVVVTDSYNYGEEQQVHDFLVQFAPYVDPATVLYGAGWAGPDAFVVPEPAPEPEPQPEPQPVETVPVVEPVVTRTETGTLFVTPYFSVEIPNGMLPEGWTYGALALDRQDFSPSAVWDGEPHGYRLAFVDSRLIGLFVVEAYQGLVEGPVYSLPPDCATQDLGPSAAGDGWQVSVWQSDYIRFELEDPDAFFAQAVACVDVNQIL